jgi:hypothetical protein
MMEEFLKLHSKMKIVTREDAFSAFLIYKLFQHDYCFKELSMDLTGSVDGLLEFSGDVEELFNKMANSKPTTKWFQMIIQDTRPITVDGIAGADTKRYFYEFMDMLINKVIYLDVITSFASERCPPDKNCSHIKQPLDRDGKFVDKTCIDCFISYVNNEQIYFETDGEVKDCYNMPELPSLPDIPKI